MTNDKRPARSEGMGEIRSTLDIIMERTKDLTMSDEEKKAFQKREVEGKVRGLLQKFLDGLTDFKGVRRGIEELGENRRPMAREVLIVECVRRIDLQADNEPFFVLLEQVTKMDVAPFRRVLSAFDKDVEEKKTVRKKELTKTLEEKGVWGTAVIPNIEADPGWNDYISQLNEELKERVTVNL